MENCPKCRAGDSTQAASRGSAGLLPAPSPGRNTGRLSLQVLKDTRTACAKQVLHLRNCRAAGAPCTLPCHCGDGPRAALSSDPSSASPAKPRDPSAGLSAAAVELLRAQTWVEETRALPRSAAGWTERHRGLSRQVCKAHHNSTPAWLGWGLQIHRPNLLLFLSFRVRC